MSNNIDLFYDMAIKRIESLENPSEFEIENELRQLANGVPYFESINEQNILDTLSKIEHVIGIIAPEASRIAEDDNNFIKWLTPERREETIRLYSEDYNDYLLNNENIPKKVVSTIDDATERILAGCGDPQNENPWIRRGMVVGSVQSGKTSNYIGLITKAADYGYKVIIVIAGIHENLRKQTQERINYGFIGYDRDSTNLEGERIGVGKKFRKDGSKSKLRDIFPWQLTFNTIDFGLNSAKSSNVPFDSKCERPLIFVIKKNPTVLENLIKWLECSPAKDLSEKINHPLLLIDDEADNASINTAYGKGAISKINSQIRKLLSQFSRASYVGYTATPFANIFIDPDEENFTYTFKEKIPAPPGSESKEKKYKIIEENITSRDLFPRHFIVGLAPPSNYLGPHFLFKSEDSKNLKILKHIPASDFNYISLDPKIHTKEYDPSVPPSLVRAIRCFFISDAIKHLRNIFEKSDSSMMINISRFTKVQNNIKVSIKDEVEDIKAAIRTYSGLGVNKSKEGLKNLEETFNQEYPHINFSWEEVLSAMKHTYKRMDIREINRPSPDVLNYKDRKNPPASFIVIGGFSLSRGLTLKGLTISYILRNSLMYDTLLQMGRWFGYREGYQDICKVWMTDKMSDDYSHITDSVEELMDELRFLEKSGKAPKDFGLKVRSHPDSLLITARNKVGKSEIIRAKIDLGGKLTETFEIKDDKKILKNNFLLTKNLIEFCFKENLSQKEIRKINGLNGLLFNDIKCLNIKRFINNFEATSYTNKLSHPEPLTRYIEKRELKELGSWDVFIPVPVNEIERRRQIKRRKIIIDGIEFLMNHRQKRDGDYNSIKLSDNNKVADTYIGKVGIDSDKLISIENNQTQKRYNPKALYFYGRKPLLVLHLLDAINIPEDDSKEQICEKYLEKLSDDSCITAWTILLPESRITEKEEEYRVNHIWQREYANDELRNSEEEINDDIDI